MKRIGSILAIILALALPGFSQFVEIPDTAFLHALIDMGVDTNGDSLISYEEAEIINELHLYSYEHWPNYGNITDLKGIEAFANLKVLQCDRNYLINLDISNNTALTWLSCGHNQLTSLDISKNTALTWLSCGCNQLTSLDVSENTALTSLWCSGNQLTNLDVSENNALTTLSCGDNQLTSLDISKQTALIWLHCSFNQLSSLDISSNTKLKCLECEDNLLISIDVTQCDSLSLLYLGNNLLTSLDLSNNKVFFTSIYCGYGSGLRLNDMPSLHEVCIWESIDIDTIFTIDTTGSPNVCFQTDCNGDCSIVGVGESCLQEVAIYPNPTGALLNIETVTPDHSSINITSLNGQLIFRGEMEGAIHQLDLSSFQKGVYFITIRSKDFVTTRKIIKPL